MRVGFLSLTFAIAGGVPEAVPEAVSTSAFWELRSSPEFTFSGCEVSFEEIFEPRFLQWGFKFTDFIFFMTLFLFIAFFVIAKFFTFGNLF